MSFIHVLDRPNDDLDNLSFTCHVVVDCVKCDRSFATSKALEAHIRHADRPGHGRLSVLNVLAFQAVPPLFADLL